MGNVIPMFALTGHPKKEEIAEKIRAFKSVGIDEVMAYPRSGCLVPYMSEEWFAVIQSTIEACEENGLKLWLYDEFNWPSGGCGGMVQKTSWKFWSKKMVSVGGKFQIVSDSRYPDLLNPDSVQTFIHLTHEQYAARFSDKFETVIRGIFTDEPCFNYIAETTDEIVYYNGMEKDYKAACGRDLFQDTQSYYEKKAPEGYAKVVFDLLALRMGDCYIGTLAKWCANHGIELTGHLLADTNIEHGTRDSGDTIAVLERFHIPGIDDIQTRVDEEYSVLEAYAHIDAVKRATGKETMIELFALGPCDMSMNRKKRSLYLAAAFGIDRYFLAVAHLDAKGNYHKLRNYFNPECSIMPDYEKTRLFCKEAQKAAAYAKKESTPDVWVRYPRETVLKYWDNGRADGKAVEVVLRGLLYALLNSQVSFGFLTEGEKGENVLCVDKDGVYDEKTGAAVPDISAWCSSKINRRVAIYENGEPAKNVFVKVYLDESFIIADCEDYKKQGRQVEIHAFGKVYSHLLLPQEVILKEDLREKETEIPVSCTFEKRMDNGVCRLYLWEEQELIAENTVKARFLIRNYPGQNKICLDGREIKAALPCNVIGNGYNPLYSMSEWTEISKGEHKVSCQGEYPERLYLPICVLMGDFESTDNRLFARQRAGNTGYFFGKADFTATVQIPDHAKEIRFMGNDLYTKLYINGEYIGEGAESRITLPVPEKFRGKNAELKFTQISTIAPLFGTTESEYCIEKNETPDWNKTFGTVQTPGGIHSVAFVTD